MSKKFLRILLNGLVVIFLLSACQEQADDNEEVQEIVIETGADSLSVNNPELVKAGEQGEFLLKAENGKASGPGIKYMPEWRAFGWFGGDNKVEWEVEVKTAGIYDVYLDWSVSDEDAGKEFVIDAKEQKITGIVGSTGSWETFLTAKVGTIKLVEGTQDIVFKPAVKFENGSLLDLRQLKLVPEK